MGDLLISYDEGISSTGWSVLKTDSFEPTLVATGDVDYPTDDCLASKSRQLRHLRRSIRSRKHCIAQIAKLFVHLELLPPGKIIVSSRQSACAPNHAQTRDFKTHPWFLASRVLAALRLPEAERVRYLLTPAQLWDVLRWYAHNRGYYIPWAKASEQSDEDTRKVAAAEAMMDHYHRKTMAETLCAAAGINDVMNPPSNVSGRFVGATFQGRRDGKTVKEVPAFPRDRTLIPEVMQILEAHRETIGNRPVFANYTFEKFVSAIVKNWRDIPPRMCLSNLDRHGDKRSQEQKERDKTERIWLPNRYEGGLLFGQRIPRFDNRIISTCPKTGEKTPLKQCREYFEFRWAMLVADIKVGDVLDEDRKLLVDARTLIKEERNALDARIRACGFFKRNELTVAVREITQCKYNNLGRMFADTPEIEESLVLQPVDRYLASKTELVHYIFPALPAKLQRNLRNGLWRGKRFNVGGGIFNKIKDDIELKDRFDEAIKTYIRERAEQPDNDRSEGACASMEGESPVFPEVLKPKRTKRNPLKSEDLLKYSFYVPPLSGRAPYCRKILIQAKKEIFGDGLAAAYDPRRYSEQQLLAEGVSSRSRLDNAESKATHGCLTGVEEVSPDSVKDDESREAEYQKWSEEWLKKLNKKGEDINRRRAAKYGEVWVRRQYETQELEKWLAKKSNNHLVRQRMLILDRLTQDIIHEFAAGDSGRVGRIAIEVARDLVTFSGLTSKQRGGDDKGVMGSIRAQHRRVAKWLSQHLSETHKHLINGRAMWLAKVAEDLNYRDPYRATHPPFDPLRLARGEYQVDHIIPKSVRLTNAMEAVVLTTSEINQRKGKMTSLQFIREMNKPENIAERDRLGICSVNSYLEFVASLKTHQTKTTGSASDEAADEGDGKTSDKINPKYLPGSQRLHPDFKRRKRRKFYMLRSEYNKDNDSFTSRQLTNTSYLNRLAQSVLLRRLPHLRPENVISIPGQVTKALRDSGGWSLFNCLGHPDVCGDAATREVPFYDRSTGIPLKDRDGRQIVKRIPVPKEDLRKLTHLHHAVDACALGLIAHWLPKHGKLWELLALGELTEKEKYEFDSIVEQFAQGELHTRFGRQSVNRCFLSQFLTCYKIENAKIKRTPDPERIYRLEAKRTPDAMERMSRIRDQIVRELSKKRVVQHIPSEHAGLPTDETTYRVVTGITGNGKIVRMVREQIEKQRRKMMELQKYFRVYEAKLEAFDQEIKSISDNVQRAAAKNERKIQRASIGKQVRDAKAKYEAAKLLLETMENFQSNAWLVKKVRRGSDAWKDIKKRLDSAVRSPSDLTEGSAGNDQDDDGGNQGQKVKKPPKLLGMPDLEKDQIVFVFDLVSRAKLISLVPLKGAKEIGTNFGIAILDGIPNGQEKFVAIPWHKVWPRIYGPNPINGEKPLIDRNRGQRPRILRVGTLIRLKKTGKSDKDGIWMVRSAKASLKLDLSRVDFPQMTKDPKVWREVSLTSLGAENIEILPNKLTGIPQSEREICLTTSSA